MNKYSTTSLKKNYFYQILYQIITLITPLITTPYISRILGVENIGKFTYAYSIATYFGMFIHLGLANYGNREIAKVRDNNQKLSKTFLEIYVMQLTMGAIVLGCYIIYIFYFSTDFIMSCIMLLYICSAIFSITWFYNGLELFKLTVIRNIFIKLLSIILIYCFVKTRNDIYIYAIIMTGDMLLSSIILWPIVKKNVQLQKISFSGVVRHIKPNVILFISVLFVSFYTVLDKIMLGMLSNMKEVGFYENAYKITSIPTMAIASLGTIMLPRISNMLVNGKKEKVKKYNEQSLILSCFLSIPISFGIVAISKEFVPLFYGDGFQKCAELLPILIFSSIFISLGNVIQTQCFIPNNLDGAYVFAAVIGALVNIFFNILLIPKYQSVGAALGTLLAEIATLLYQMWIAKKYINIKRTVYLSMPFAICGGIMFFCISNIYLDNVITSIVIKIIVGGFIYIFLSLLYFLVILRRLNSWKYNV